jgi:NAD(P) transhydrogenase subunit alpha
VPDQVVDVNGVTIVGTANLANLTPGDATQMYASNMFNLVEDTWDEDSKQFVLDLENDILPGCVITHGGAVVHPTIKDIIEGAN